MHNAKIVESVTVEISVYIDNHSIVIKPAWSVPKVTDSSVVCRLCVGHREAW